MISERYWMNPTASNKQNGIPNTAATPIRIFVRNFMGDLIGFSVVCVWGFWPWVADKGVRGTPGVWKSGGVCVVPVLDVPDQATPGVNGAPCTVFVCIVGD